MRLLESLPANRLLMYILLVGILPLAYACGWFISESNHLQEVESLFDMVSAQSAVKERKQSQNQIVIQTFKEQEHFYIDKHLETLVFLENEIEQLEKLINSSIPVSEQLLKRYEKLTTQENQLHFIEGQVQSTPHFQEVMETLAHPVEINVLDLQKILSNIEGVDYGIIAPNSGRPQLLITDFKLDKKKTHGNNEAFVLNLKLLKREYL